jgi:hypothetical protein
VNWVAKLALGWLVVLALAGFWWSQPHKHEGPHTAPFPGPYHLEWELHDVAGFHLLSPVVDSLGQHLSWTLPEGAILSIPHEVEGPNPDAPDSVRSKS